MLIESALGFIKYDHIMPKFLAAQIQSIPMLLN